MPASSLPRFRWSFGTRLAVAFVAMGLATAALTASLVNVAFSDRFDRYLDASHQQREAQLVAALADTYAQSSGWNPAALDRAAAALLMDGGSIDLVDAGGDAVWTGSGGRHAELHRQMMGTGPLGPEQALPVEVDGQLVGTATVRLPQVGMLPRDVDFRRSVNWLLALAGLLAGGIAVGVGLLVARRTTAPVRDLTRAAGALAAGDRAHRVAVPRGDEFGDMAGAFNRMADELEAEDRLRRGFAADIAHELRTPLMILRGEIEALEDGIAIPTPDTLGSLREETLRLARLVDDLDTLARADAAGFTLDRQPTAVGEVIVEVAEGLAASAAEADVHVEVDAGDVAVVEADRARLAQVVRNLLMNAFRFTPAGGAVRVRVGRDGGAAVVEVVDSGPGIPADELDRVFDRFFRGRHARSGGSGIGLTVVRQLVEAHGGTVVAANAPAGGAMFTVRLPLVQAPAPT